MSGPKVVRIVTREEIEAICRQHIASAEEAAAELRRCAKRHDALSDALTADVEGRIRQLRRLFEEDRWMELQKQAPIAVTFLKTETQHIRARAIAAAEATRSKGRRIADAAKTIISAMEASGHEVPLSLRNVAKGANLADMRELLAMEDVLSWSYAAFAARRSAIGPSKQQLELAGRLESGDRPETFPEWLAAQSWSVSQRDSRLDSLMAEIETLEDAEIVRSFRERAVAITAEALPGRRALLTDSLVLDLSERSRQRRENEVRAERLREVQTALRTLGTSETHAMETQVASMLQTAKLDGADNLVTRARALIEGETAKLAAVARRRAVLEGLAELGYEVRESMTTAWVRDGRLVVHKPGGTDYGVELGAPQDMSRLQVRLVGSDRPSIPRNAQRDRDMEMIWCSEFGRLQQLVANSGGEVYVQRALDVGVEPVKTINFIDLKSEVRKEHRQMAR
jgi:hypothetical protein